MGKEGEEDLEEKRASREYALTTSKLRLERRAY